MKTRKTLATLGITAARLAGTLSTATADTTSRSHAAVTKPSIVLIHGAFEDATAFSGVTRRLQASGYHVVAPAVPLRGISSDVAYLDSVLDTIQGPIVLVGHSYGGALVSELAAHNSQVTALVYAAAFIPETGETINALNSQFPGTLIGPDTTFTATTPAGTDLYVRQESYRDVYAGDRTPGDALTAAAAQRPLDTAALTEPTTTQAPAAIPKFALVATRDHAVPAQAEQFEAERAGAHIYRVDSAHDMAVTHPGEVVNVVETAADYTPKNHTQPVEKAMPENESR